MTDFQFDVNFDESLFSLAPPVGYTVKKATEPAEQDLIEGLRAIAEFLDGEFPPVQVLNWNSMREVLGNHVKKNNLSPTEDEMTIFSEKVRSVTRFVGIKKLRDHDPNYTGKGVKLGDVDKPVIRWQLNSKTYRVIYGDLSMKDVARENLLK